MGAVAAGAGAAAVIGSFSPNTHTRMSNFQGLIIYFEMYLPLHLTFPFLLPLLKYHFSPCTPNGESFEFIVLYLPYKLVLMFM